MRKDFLVDPVQLDEAAACGAGGVLLILGLLDTETMDRMLRRAMELRLFVLLEAFDAPELGRAALLSRGREDRILVGLNCRNLSTLQVDPARFSLLAPSLPSKAVCVAESGLRTGMDAARVAQSGYAMALVGSALMEATEPASYVTRLLAQGRAAVGLPMIKICGLQTPEGVSAAVEAGADSVGFVLVDSPRQVTPEQARALAALLPSSVSAIGVFRTLDEAAVEQAYAAGLNAVQGAPTVRGLQMASAMGLRCLSTLLDGPELPEALASQPGPVLVDGPKSGSGQLADLDRVARLAADRPLVLAGGLRPENVADAIAQVRPAGVDVSSGVERTRGVKDPERIRQFVGAARTALDAVAEAIGGLR